MRGLTKEERRELKGALQTWRECINDYSDDVVECDTRTAVFDSLCRKLGFDPDNI